MSLPKTVGGVETIQVPCCACPGVVSFATPEATPNPTFFHTLPYCQRFDATNSAADLVQYLKDCIDFQTDIERK